MPHMNKLSSYITVVFAEAGKQKVVYHSTCIVEWDNDAIVLNTGGWKSVTTKRKMNQAANQFDLGFGVFQKKGEWFVEYKGKTIPFDRDEIWLCRFEV